MTKTRKPKTRPYRVSADAKLHPVLQEQLGELRDGLVGAAEGQHLPARFTARAHADHPSFVITDHNTGHATTVPLFAYGEVRAALADLFPDEGRSA
jgi:hypothetical protein